MTFAQTTGNRSTHISANSELGLVGLAKTGDTQALDTLIRQLRPIVYAKSRKYYLVGGDREDVIQEGLIGLYKAIRDFRVDSHLSFRAFASVCIDRQLFTAIKCAARLKPSPLNYHVPLESRYSRDSDDLFLYDRISLSIADDPVDYLAAREGCALICRCAAEKLSEFEARVLAMFAEGLSYDEIAGLEGRDLKAVDNALQRARRKMSQAIGCARSSGVTTQTVHCFPSS